MTTPTSAHHTADFDEKLYDRQIYVIGHEAMKRMAKSNVLVVGLGGLGVEVAKNIILAGVKSVTLHDSKTVTYNDLSAQFYLNETHIGANRADACIAQLHELNPYVSVHVHNGELTDSFLQTFSVVVFTDTPISQLVAVNELARNNSVKFVAAESRGVFGAVFCDFGTQFEVTDVDGETPVSNIVTGITNDAVPTINVHDDKPKHGLYDGEFVFFEDVQGMTEINDTKPIEIVPTGRHTFTLKNFDTSKFGKYTAGGTVKQFKMPKLVDFVSLKDSLANASPSFIETDFAKFGRPADLHAIFKAYNEFIIRNKREPKPYNAQDADQLVTIAKEFKADVNEDVTRKFAFTCTGNLNANAAFLGGIIAQEVQKAVSGKFHPLHQWLYFDAIEVLPEPLPTEEDATPLNCRYDGQIVVFGNKFQQELLNKKVFIVGAGALGCEYLKNYALVGVGCGPKGKIIVTDMDNIEISNLSRQFLFRKKHIGKMKSQVASEAAKEMNAALNITSLCDKVAPQTEAIFDDEFWEGLDCVTNALDNIQARLYIDSRCVYYKLPLMEAGTLGTKANMQVVIPNLTESYGSSADPPEQEIPICTLKNFPNAIEHTIQWARDMFEGLFKQAPDDVNAYLSKGDEFIKELESQGGGKKPTLEGILENLVSSRPSSFEECIAWARFKFELLYNNQIQQLLHNFPLDMVTSSGTPFWGGPKRPPTALSFDIHDKTHVGFVIAAATLRANIYGLKPTGNVQQILASINVPTFSPQSGVKIAIDAEANKTQTAPPTATLEDEEICVQIIDKLPKPASMAGYHLNAIQFEKDDDSNHHVEFITHCSNLRARNYKIKEASVHQTKGIAGKIIPAMVTTTASITGLAMFEFYKLMQKRTKLDDYKNAFLNIAIPFVTLSEPTKPAQNKMQDTTWTLWDRFEISLGRDVTMKEFIDFFQNKYKLEITMMSSGSAVIYSFFGNKKKIQERMAMPMAQVVQDVSKIEFAAKQRYINIEVCCSDAEGNDVDVPFIKYQFQHFQ